MAVKNRKIIMNGNCWGTYQIKFTTYIKLQFIRLYLYLVRLFRRTKRGLSYCKYALVTIPFWLIYIIGVSFWSVQRGQVYPVIDILWDIKLSVFTSIILASITAFITQYSKNKFSYLEQHRIYLRIMGNCSMLYKDLLNLLCYDYSKDNVPFWPFYIEKMSNSVYRCFSKNYEIDSSRLEYKHVVVSIVELRRSLEELERSQYNGIMANCNRTEISALVVNCLDCLFTLERQLDSSEQNKHWDYRLSCIADQLYQLIDYLRLPWRRDNKLKLLSLEMIYKEDEKIAATFYNSAFLDVVDYEFYANLDTYIQQLREEFREYNLEESRVQQHER